MINIQNKENKEQTYPSRSPRSSKRVSLRWAPFA